ncbi:MAG: PaaX family transcriptional regulator C-terminal domain-containing protein [Ilumatobacteraceae bacterium]
MSATSSAAVTRLRDATCSDGAPSARNLLVTVFGDALLPHGVGNAVSVRSLATLLEPFGVSERLVRTSLTRLVNDGILRTKSVGRRSFYAIESTSRPLFRSADARIYGSRRGAWDRSWTIVVIDGSEATPAKRARLRQRLTWAGLGNVAPNVMASPVVTPEEVALVVEQTGGFTNVLVSRSHVFDGPGTLDENELARRCAPLDEVAAQYDRFVDEFDDFDRATLNALPPAEAFKLRMLLVARYRRIVLVDPLLPESLLPDGWAGARARALAAFVYGGCADAAERQLAAVTELADGTIVPDANWLHGRFIVE